MDRQMVVNLIRNEVVECPRGKSRLWVVRCFEITARPDEPVVEVDEYEAYEVYEEDDEAHDACCRPSRMFHVGRSVIHVEQKRVIEEPAGKGLVEFGAMPATR